MTTEEQLKEIVNKYDLKSKSREHEYVLWKRQYFCYYAYQLGLSYQSIGKLIGRYKTNGKPDHSTARHSSIKCQDFLDTQDPDFLTNIIEISEDLKKVTPLEKNTKDKSTKNHYLELINKLFEAKSMEDVEELKKYVMDNIDKNRLK